MKKTKGREPVGEVRGPKEARSGVRREGAFEAEGLAGGQILELRGEVIPWLELAPLPGAAHDYIYGGLRGADSHRSHIAPRVGFETVADDELMILPREAAFEGKGGGCIACDQNLLKNFADQVRAEAPKRVHQAAERHEIECGHLLGFRPTEFSPNDDLVFGKIDLVLSDHVAYGIADLALTDLGGELGVGEDEFAAAEQFKYTAFVKGEVEGGVATALD